MVSWSCGLAVSRSGDLVDLRLPKWEVDSAAARTGGGGLALLCDEGGGLLTFLSGGGAGAGVVQ